MKTANIFEVMYTLVMTFNVSKFLETGSVLSRLRQQQLKLLLVVDNQGNIVGNITPENIKYQSSTSTRNREN
ncbi:hypothetical protein [Nostoc sp.]|uniref:hypothetical protein n=1 Tax=Nostoc sp. TaxID=1180 RepID=UPI002FF87025